jgi:hypothetical protein
VTIATVTAHMTTVKNLKLYRLLLAGLIVLTLAAMHVFVVAVLLAAGKAGEVQDRTNPWLDAAQVISWENPELYAAQAAFYRKRALLHGWGPTRATHLTTSLSYWQQAQAASPLWPYYQLGALDVEVMLSSSESVIQNRISNLLTLAPNERGLDKYLLQLAFITWPNLNESQQNYMLKRLQESRFNVLKFVYNKAKEAGNHQAICVNLPWKQVRKLCK